MAPQTTAMAVSESAETSGSEPAPREIMRKAFEALRAGGVDCGTVTDLEAPEHTDVSGGVTPEYANLARKMDNAGCFDDLTLEEELKGARGDSAASNVTTIYVRRVRSITEAIKTLADSGQIEAAIENVLDELTGDIDASMIADEELTRLEAKAAKITAYQLATFAKGWVAESIICDSDLFAKGWVSNDEMEQDVRRKANGRYEQVKCVTLGAKPNHTIYSVEGESGRFNTTKNDVPVLFYQWDCDGQIVVGMDYKAVNAEAASAKGVSKTTIYRTHSAYKMNGRTYRRLWW